MTGMMSVLKLFSQLGCLYEAESASPFPPADALLYNDGATPLIANDGSTYLIEN